MMRLARTQITALVIQIAATAILAVGLTWPRSQASTSPPPAGERPAVHRLDQRPWQPAGAARE